MLMDATIYDTYEYVPWCCWCVILIGVVPICHLDSEYEASNIMVSTISQSSS